MKLFEPFKKALQIGRRKYSDKITDDLYNNIYYGPRRMSFLDIRATVLPLAFSVIFVNCLK